MPEFPPDLGNTLCTFDSPFYQRVKFLPDIQPMIKALKNLFNPMPKRDLEADIRELQKRITALETNATMGIPPEPKKTGDVLFDAFNRPSPFLRLMAKKLSADEVITRFEEIYKWLKIERVTTATVTHLRKATVKRKRR